MTACEARLLQQNLRSEEVDGFVEAMMGKKKTERQRRNEEEGVVKGKKGGGKGRAKGKGKGKTKVRRPRETEKAKLDRLYKKECDRLRQAIRESVKSSGMSMSRGKISSPC